MRFDDLGRAQIVKALLEGSGIGCSLINDVAQSILPNLSTESPIRLVVKEEDREKAMSILSASYDRDEMKEEMKEAKKDKEKLFKAK